MGRSYLDVAENPRFTWQHAWQQTTRTRQEPGDFSCAVSYLQR